MHVVFPCPSCERPARVSLTAASEWRCPACHHDVSIKAAEPALAECTVCGNHELYKRKDFPHWIGMAILVGACLASVYTYFWYEKWLTWAILIGSAIIDGGLYLMVGDAIVCYRCDAEHKGFTATDAHPPFELTVGERYRQTKLREELASRERQRPENITPPVADAPGPPRN